MVRAVRRRQGRSPPARRPLSTMTMDARAPANPDPGDVETPYAWRRLLISLLLSTIGGIGLWSAIVVLPSVQAEFGVARASASLPYTATMIGFAFGGIVMGRLA